MNGKRIHIMQTFYNFTHLTFDKPGIQTFDSVPCDVVGLCGSSAIEQLED